MARNKQFGELVDEGICSVVKRQRKGVPEVEEEIAITLGYTHYNIERWRRGYIPQQSDQVAFLARYCVTNGRVNREWAASLLVQAGYSNREALLQELFPGRLPRMEIPRVYENLPPRYGDILGRQGDIARVLEGLERWPLVVIEGLSGVGKSTLALETARRCLSDFKAVVWVSAKNRPDQKRWLPEVLDVIARVLDYPYITQLSTAEKIVEVGKLLRAHRVLVIIDNFETMDDPDLEYWMQKTPEPSRVLITSRQVKQLATVVVWDIHLHGLAMPEALDLIRRHARRLGLTRVETATQGEILPLVQVTEGNPKAIEMALGHVKHGLSFSEVIDHLRAASKTMRDVFDYLFTYAWETLGEDARRLLLVMPFFVDSAHKESLATAELTGYTLDLALKQLVELSLFDVNGEVNEAKQRYSVHPLVRSFASDKLRNAAEFEKQARVRWCKYFLDFTARHVVWNKAKPRYWNSLGGGGLTPIDPELPNLLAVLAWANQNDDIKTLIELMMLLVHYMDRRALYSQRILYARRAAEAAQKLGQAVDEALFRIDALGWTFIEEGRLIEAEQEIVLGLHIAEKLGAENVDARDLMALAYAFLARVFLLQANETKASDLIGKALQMDCRPPIRDRVLVTAGELAHKRQEYKAALEFYQESMRVDQEYSSDEENDDVHQHLGFIYLSQGDLAQAEAEFSALSTATHQVGAIEAIYAKYGLARIAQIKGEQSKACQLAQEALDSLSRLHIGHRLLKELQDYLANLESIDPPGN